MMGIIIIINGDEVFPATTVLVKLNDDYDIYSKKTRL